MRDDSDEACREAAVFVGWEKCFGAGLDVVVVIVCEVVMDDDMSRTKQKVDGPGIDPGTS